METITLQYNPNSAFATALAALLHDSKEVSIMEKKVAKRRHKTNYEKTLEACKDDDEGRLNSYESVDDFFEKMGMPCQSRLVANL